MIKAVIFDFGQTLVDSASGFRSAEKQAEMRIFNDLTLTSWQDFIENYREIRKRFKEDSNFSRKLLWKEIYSSYSRECNDGFLEKWENEYWEEVKRCTTPFPEMEHVLEELHTRYMLAVITNTQGLAASGTHRIAGFPQLEQFFKEIIIAGESGIPPKPDPLPFNMCIDELGVKKEQAVYVGDDWNIDILGAMGAGLKPVWLKHHLVKRNWPEPDKKVPVITSLDQLLDLNHLLLD
jgi:HAD superfamily hydrolase (TIGR01549 family)